MAIIINKRINLDAPIKLESLCGFTFTTESEAHQFVVRCDQNGHELTLAGTISAKFVRADGNTVELVGTIEDGKAVVTLAQDCYNVYGRFQLAIFNTVGNTKLCIYACIGTVQRAQSGNLIDGGGIIPDVEDLIADIQTAVESIPPSYTTLLASVAGTYSASKTYSVGDYAWYNGTLYRCSTAISTAEAWTSGHWTAAVLGDDLSGLKSAINILEPAATEDSVGKALKVKTVSNGKVTEYEFGETAEIDTTLTQSGQAADAKTTGDEIASVVSSLSSDLEGFAVAVNSMLNMLCAILENALYISDQSESIEALRNSMAVTSIKIRYVGMTAVITNLNNTTISWDGTKAIVGGAMA